MRAARKPNIETKLRRLMSPARSAPLYAAGSAVRAYRSTDQSIPNATLTSVQLNTDRWDTDTMHFTSSANLTGTVSKVAGNSNLGGGGTLFTTELSVGQVISVPGGATERAVVIAITDDTHATVQVASTDTWANTASGQTATRVNSALVANTPGLYQIFGQWRWDANGTGRREVRIMLNGTINLAIDIRAPLATSAGEHTIGTQWRIQQWDFVELYGFQNSGGALSCLANTNDSPEFGMARIGPA